jgi:hypothetical protein
MHVSSDRFDLTRADKAGIEAFKKHVWHNPEVCSHCFSRVRAVGETVTVHKSVHRHEVNKFYERTETGSQEYTPWDENKRYGTCFCEHCGADLQPEHQNLPWETMKSFAVSLYNYTTNHTSLQLNGERFAAELRELRTQRLDTAGREMQIFAVAFARALQTDVSASGTELATAD